MRLHGATWPAAALFIAAIACNGHFDFGAGGAACAGDGDCHLASLHCDVAGSRTCVACAGDAHCTAPGLGRCDLALHRCVACVGGTDCASVEACVAGRCVIRCQDDVPNTCPGASACHSDVCGFCGEESVTACAALPATPLCLISAGLCVGCRDDADCGGGATPRCDPVRKACVQCASGGDCAAAKPFCDPDTGICSAG